MVLIIQIWCCSDDDYCYYDSTISSTVRINFWYFVHHIIWSRYERKIQRVFIWFYYCTDLNSVIICIYKVIWFGVIERDIEFGKFIKSLLLFMEANQLTSSINVSFIASIYTNFLTWLYLSTIFKGVDERSFPLSSSRWTFS